MIEPSAANSTSIIIPVVTPLNVQDPPLTEQRKVTVGVRVAALGRYVSLRLNCVLVIVWLELGEPPQIAVNVAACVTVVLSVTADVFTIGSALAAMVVLVALKMQFGCTVPDEPTVRA